jgi:membrane protease subunit HflK
MQDILDKYDIGIRVVAVKLQDINPPEIVKPSFNEVVAAKQEQEQLINEAEEAYNKVIPEARGKAEKSISNAEGFAAAVVNRATGDADKFEAVLKEYKRAPAITRRRIYLETMEDIFSRFEKMTIVDSKVQGLLPVFSKDKSTKVVE